MKEPTLDVFNKLKNMLDENQITYELSQHEATITSDDAARIRGVDLSTGAKSMILKSRTKFIQTILPGNKRINYKILKNELGLKDLSLASEDQVYELTGLVKGSVPPFGKMLGFDTYVDPALLENEYINFNAGSVSISIKMKSKDWFELTKPEVINFAE